MMKTLVSSVLLLLLALGFAHARDCPPSPGELADSVARLSDTSAGSIDTVIADTTAGDSTSPEAQEAEFQQGLDALFETSRFPVDTFAWCTNKINSGRFDSEKWADTARISLVDTLGHSTYVHPFNNYVTSGFGQRRWVWHYGVDVKLQKGDTVRAAFDGVVRVIQYDRRGYGLVVVVRHQNGLETIYGHLSCKSVAVNQRVRSGDIIGLGGNTGRSTGSHLHFEVRYRGEPIDPNCFVDFGQYTTQHDTLVLTKANFEYLVELRKTQWHRIRSGENLGLIARRYHTSVRTLCRLNRLTPRTILRVGRRIIVKAYTRTDPTATLPAPAAPGSLLTPTSPAVVTGIQ